MSNLEKDPDLLARYNAFLATLAALDEEKQKEINKQWVRFTASMKRHLEEISRRQEALNRFESEPDAQINTAMLKIYPNYKKHLDDQLQQALKDKNKCITNFQDTIYTLLKGHNSLKAMKIGMFISTAILIGVACAVGAAIAGACVGFALGVWSGPGAFVSAFAAGSSSAMLAWLLTSVGFGLLGFGASSTLLIVPQLITPKPVKETITALGFFTEKVRSSDLPAVEEFLQK